MGSRGVKSKVFKFHCYMAKFVKNNFQIIMVTIFFENEWKFRRCRCYGPHSKIWWLYIGSFTVGGLFIIIMFWLAVLAGARASEWCHLTSGLVSWVLCHSSRSRPLSKLCMFSCNKCSFARSYLFEFHCI